MTNITISIHLSKHIFIHVNTYIFISSYTTLIHLLQLLTWPTCTGRSQSCIDAISQGSVPLDHRLDTQTTVLLVRHCVEGQVLGRGHRVPRQHRGANGRREGGFAHLWAQPPVSSAGQVCVFLVHFRTRCVVIFSSFCWVNCSYCPPPCPPSYPPPLPGRL